MSLFGEIKGFTGEYSFLSNFWPVPIVLDGVQYASTEHAYQAAKTYDVQERTYFLRGSAAVAKRNGRYITLRPDWEDVKIPIMFDLNRQKYRDPVLRRKLLDTGDKYIEETNYWNDVFWGVSRGVGRNELGKILMLIRQEIVKEINDA